MCVTTHHPRHPWTDPRVEYEDDMFGVGVTNLFDILLFNMYYK